MFHSTPPLAFPLSRLIQAGILILSLVGVLIPTRNAQADEPPPLVPGGWRAAQLKALGVEPKEGPQLTREQEEAMKRNR